MFSSTLKKGMKPYLHAFSPGARASEKGMLYRNNNMNAHARVASIQQAQRSHREGALNEHEFYQRNREMSSILEAHRDAIEGTQEVVGARPAVLSPPGETLYHSKSGDFA